MNIPVSSVFSVVKFVLCVLCGLAVKKEIRIIMNKKILVVDDDIDIAFILKKILENSGYEVICVNNGFEAVKTAKLIDLSLITLDIMMEDSSGIEVINTLRQNKETAKIPIIIITSLNGSIKELCNKYNNVYYILKPFLKEKIIEEVKRLTK